MLQREAMETIASVLKEVLTSTQIHEVLESITARITNGYCPICEYEEIPVDEQGNEIEGLDVSMADDWLERHDSICLVTLLEGEE